MGYDRKVQRRLNIEEEQKAFSWCLGTEKD
jgi:hypothetical protein